MEASKAEPSGSSAPLIVRSHVMPWGFLVALPLALAFAYLGAWGLDAALAPDFVAAEDAPLWLFSLPLLAFSLFLFLVGVGELARYLKPAVEVIVDGTGVTTFDLLGARRTAWGDMVEARVEGGQLCLRGRTDRRGSGRELRLNFNRLAIEPVLLVQRIAVHRPDLVVVPQQAANDDGKRDTGV